MVILDTNIFLNSQKAIKFNDRKHFSFINKYIIKKIKNNFQ